MVNDRKSMQVSAGELGRKTGRVAGLWRGRRRGLALIALAVAAVAGAWGGWRYFSHPRTGIERIRNVVLISIDTCRADRLSCYGYKRSSTPSIDAVAREGVLFKNALTPVPVTTPAHASMLTGTYPPTHGLRMNSGECLADSNVTLADVLQKAGYQTAAFVGAFPLDSRFGLNQGFDTYDCQYTRKRFPEFTAPDERTAEEVSRPALAWLEKNAAKPFFLFLHYYDPHLPYAPPPPYASSFADDPYAGEIAYVDHWIGQIMDRLRAMGVYDNTLVIITADHGESLGEHGETSHGFLMYQSTMHVPLVIRAPHAGKGLNVKGNVDLVDIVPTVLDLAGLKTPSQVQGRSLRRSLEDGSAPDPSRPMYGEAIWPATFECGALYGIVEGAWKYVRAPRQELYDLTRDFVEGENVAEKEPEVARRLRARLEAMLKEMESTATRPGRSTVDPDAIRRLQGLGYMSGGAVPASSAFDPKREDPKDFLPTYESLLKLCGPISANRDEEGKKELLEIVRRRPKLITARAMLAQLAVTEGRLADAAGQGEEIVSILTELKESPKPVLTDAAELTAGQFDTRDLAKAHFNLAIVLKDLGKAQEAIKHYEEALRIKPNYADAHLNLGAVLQQAGRLPEAIGHYEQVLLVKPDYAMAHGNLAMALQRTGKLPEAIGHYEQALRLKPDYARNNPVFAAALGEARSASEALERCRKALATRPADAEAHTELGNVLLRIGQVAEAIGHYEEASRARPDSAPAHYNLALAMGQAGRASEAIAHQKEAIRLSGDFVLAMNYLAWMLATQDDPKLRDGAQAVRLAERACELTARKEWSLLDTLAAAYAEAGRFPEAVATAQKALAMAQSANHASAVADVQSRLALYRAGQCYREPPPGPGRP